MRRWSGKDDLAHAGARGLRLARYAAGILLVSVGIVLCKKCGLGISPISCVPLVLAAATPLSFGTFTSIFHAVNTVAQMALAGAWRDVRLWLQFPLALAFGMVIDTVNALLPVEGASLASQIFLLAGSVFFTAAGMVLMVGADLVQNPPDGTVRQVSVMTGRPFGSVKVVYDVMCVVLAAVLGILLLGRLEGLGVATLASALLVGRTVSWIRDIAARMRSGKVLVNAA